MSDFVESRPSPDPTDRTNQQLTAEMQNTRELTGANLKALAELTHERFVAVDQRFVMNEAFRLEQKAETKEALAAALSAAKEAVKEQTLASEKSITKSETATSEQLKQLSTTFDTRIGGVTDSQADLKDRLVSLESRREESNANVHLGLETRHTNAGVQSATYAFVGTLLLIVSIIVTLVASGALK
jgi:hypothetical protein